MKPRAIGMKIQRLREKRGMTQEVLAAKAGLSRGFLARLETGRHDPSLTTVGKLAKALKVDLGELVE